MVTVSVSIITTCVLTIPQLGPRTISVPGNPNMGVRFAFAPTNTDWVGGTSCGVSQHVLPTAPFTSGYITPTVKCTWPASRSGATYSITPFIVDTLSGPQWPRATVCDPIAPAALNAAKFSIRCPSILGKNLRTGWNTVSFLIPPGVPTIANYGFSVISPSTVTTFLLNTALAKTTLVPQTVVTSTTTTWISRTLATQTSTVKVYTGMRTYTCFVSGSTSIPASTSVPVATVVPRSISPLDGLDAKSENVNNSENPTAVDLDENFPTLNNPSPHIPEENFELKERDENRGKQLAKRAPSIGRPNFTYPPFPSTTVYVTAFSTSIYTELHVSITQITPPVVVVTRTYEAYTQITVTVYSTTSRNTNTTTTTATDHY